MSSLYRIEFSSVVLVKGCRTPWGAMKKAKKELKDKLGNTLYRELVTDMKCTRLPIGREK